MSNNYRIRIKKGEYELEVEGDKEFVQEKYEEFKTETENLPFSNTGFIKNLIHQEEHPILKHSIQKIYKSLSLKTKGFIQHTFGSEMRLSGCHKLLS